MAPFRIMPSAPVVFEHEVDIIIPIYNGRDYLVKLIDSILRNTDSPYRLILVDDASSDAGIRPFMRQIAAQRPGTVLLFNEANRGFPKSVNSGVEQARHNFVILNTDVEVPPGWLPRLMGQIFDDDRVASTTPFTNSGSLCSFPNMYVDNEIFEGLTVDEIDAVFKYIDQSVISVDLPTAVGFCMGINLKAWRQIGPFNDKVFGRGYAEEGDWCIRAASAGYRHRMVNNLFVYHKHGASFDKIEKQELVQKNNLKLRKIYPFHHALYNRFIRNDPRDPMCRFATLLLSAKQAGKNRTNVMIAHLKKGEAVNYSDGTIQERLSAGELILLLSHQGNDRFMKLTALYKQYQAIFSMRSLSDLIPLFERVQYGKVYNNNIQDSSELLEPAQLVAHLQKQCPSVKMQR